MARTRTYGDTCGIARALDVIGDRWALLIVRELVFGPKRFGDLQAGLVRIGPDVLAQRLRDLEGAGLVERTALPAPARVAAYRLTARGHELEPVLQALGRFGSTLPLPESGPPLSVDATVMALVTMFSPQRAGRLAARYELWLGDEPFRLTVAEGRIDVERGRADEHDAVITTTAASLAAILWHGDSLDDAIEAGEVGIEGSRRLVDRFVRLFPLLSAAPR